MWRNLKGPNKISKHSVDFVLKTLQPAVKVEIEMNETMCFI